MMYVKERQCQYGQVQLNRIRKDSAKHAGAICVSALSMREVCVSVLCVGKPSTPIIVWRPFVYRFLFT